MTLLGQQKNAYAEVGKAKNRQRFQSRGNIFFFSFRFLCCHRGAKITATILERDLSQNRKQRTSKVCLVGRNHSDKEKLNEVLSKALEKKAAVSLFPKSHLFYPFRRPELTFLLATFSKAQYDTPLEAFVRERCDHTHLEERALWDWWACWAADWPYWRCHCGSNAEPPGCSSVAPDCNFDQAPFTKDQEWQLATSAVKWTSVAFYPPYDFTQHISRPRWLV